LIERDGGAPSRAAVLRRTDFSGAGQPAGDDPDRQVAVDPATENLPANELTKSRELIG
jgi:hypothetical protein